jgi:hypothetical protein
MLAALAAGCGNYSNEDLEFMNALPERDALAVAIPPVTSAIALAREAELARATHDTTRGLNALSGSLVAIVDAVRSFPPTARTDSSRIWGPFPNDPKGKNPTWQTRMIVSRNDNTAGQFDYEIDEHEVGTADTDWSVFVRGFFLGGRSARRGTGHVELLTADVRAKGLDVSDLGVLDHLEIDYDTLADPLTLTMHITDLPDPGSTEPAPRAEYRYRANALGQGEMTFDLFKNVVPGDAIEDVRIVSQWLPTGEGMATLMVVSGDGMGVARQLECWDRSFAATYNDKPFAPGEDVPATPPGDPTGFCPVIPPL